VTSLCAALLHDVVEDTKSSAGNISEHFGADVARLWKAQPRSAAWICWRPKPARRRTFAKMLLAMVNDVRVVVIKLADRLHNMRTLEYLDSEKQQSHRARDD